MGLQLYRRHSKACKAKRPEDSRTGKFEEGRRNWKKCSCQIFASGTLGGKFKRQCTEKWEWDKAEELVDGWQKAGSWPSGLTPPVSVPAHPMAKLPKHHDGAEHRFFLLTRLRNGRVKADRVRTDDDSRLRSRAAFALITLDSAPQTDDELNPADEAGRGDRSAVYGGGEGYLLRPQIANSIKDFRGLFQALRDATEDTMLEIDPESRSDAEWRVCAD